MRGALAKSAEIHRLQGTRCKAGTATPKKNIKAVKEAPADNVTAPPPELQGVALAEWQRLAPLLRERGMLSPLDRNHLQLYCEQWSVYRQAVAAMAETGIAIPTAAGGSKTSPFGLVIESTSRSLRGLAGELGLHFLSRSRLGIKESEATTKSEWDEFL